MPPLVFSLVLAAACCHALWNFFSKKVSGNFTILWYGLVLANSVLFPYSLYVFFVDGTNFGGIIPAAVSALAHSGYFITLCYNYSQGGDISTVYPIARGTGVIGTTILAAVLFKEIIRLSAAFGIAAVCLGILCIALDKIRNQRFSGKSYIVAVLTGVFTLVYSLADKQGVRYIPPIAYNTIITLAAIIPLGGQANAGGIRESLKLLRKYFKEAVIIGFGCTGTYILILWAMQFERASYIIPVREFSVVIASALGFIFLKEKPTVFKIGGILSITAGIFMIKTG
jgi:drug/metabolite transporter (DMT)-like permease